ncbi:MAG TPA: aminoacetone oxidase family FAD-binding enzyme [Clostridiales bacterium]|nr:aminoacetone oxidase family FAD-binding enzyme [Clostridiales bacterium]
MKTIVIGGGASGLACAIESAKCGNDVTIIEKNEKIGKKLYITGKGRCNITNDCSETEFLENVVTNPKFLKSSIYAFNSVKTIELFESNGLQLKTERGRRVFPFSDKSSDVIKTLGEICKRNGVKIHLQENVLDLMVENNVVKGVITDKCEYFCDKVVICTGGKSYSSTGSTGDGYKFAKKTGHTLVQLKPALCPMYLNEKWVKQVQGLSLKNVTLTAFANQKIVFSQMGELLFTHFGISGPLVLSASSFINKYALKDVYLILDLKPALSYEQLSDRILRDFLKYKNKDLQNALIDLLPKSLIKPIISLSGISPIKKTDVVTKEERKKLVETLKNIKFTLSKFASVEESIITSGGVSVNDINPKTMESKKISNLFFAGEVIDTDALTGGYNLQIAFSTGFVASRGEKND